MELRHERSQPIALVNPEIVSASSATDKSEEGCLSIPDVFADVERPSDVVVRALFKATFFESFELSTYAFAIATAISCALGSPTCGPRAAAISVSPPPTGNRR